MSATLAAASLVSADFDDGATVRQTADRGDRVDVTRAASSTARYRVTMVIDWSRATHPATLPPASHVSPPVLVNHRARGDLFRVGTNATPGIEIMAERGGSTTLLSEQRSRATVDEATRGAGVNGTGSNSFTVTVDRSNRYLSLVTMLAPSPDWFLGVDSLDLYAGGFWASRIEIPLGAYDAGTDSGSRFTSGDANTSPAQPISGPRDSGFIAAAAEGSFGWLIVERLP